VYRANRDIRAANFWPSPTGDHGVNAFSLRSQATHRAGRARVPLLAEVAFDPFATQANLRASSRSPNGDHGRQTSAGTPCRDITAINTAKSASKRRKCIMAPFPRDQKNSCRASRGMNGNVRYTPGHQRASKQPSTDPAAAINAPAREDCTDISAAVSIRKIAILFNLREDRSFVKERREISVQSSSGRAH